MKTNKLDIIFFPFHDWKKCEKEGFRTRDAHLIQCFEKDPLVRKMLIIDRPTSIPEMLFEKYWWRVKSGKVISKKMNVCLTHVSEKIYVLDILSLDSIRPIFLKRLWWDYIFRQTAIIKEINKAIKNIDLDNKILFIWYPFAIGVIGKIGEKLFVYDAMDNWVRHPEMRDIHKELGKISQRIKKEADLIFTVSKRLRNIMDTGRSNVFFVPNGVGINFIDSHQNKKIPNDLRNIPRPTIGYAGNLAQRINVALLTFLSSQLPDVSFVLIGQILNRKWIKPLFKLNNIYFLGNKHYSLLRDYLLGFDICMIPHNVGELENDGDPIKLYEYLAVGKPVVTTNIAGVDVFRNSITIAKTKEEFLEGIIGYIQALNQGDDISEKLRKSISADCYWSNKAHKMINLIIKKWKERDEL